MNFFEYKLLVDFVNLYERIIQVGFIEDLDLSDKDKKLVEILEEYGDIVYHYSEVIDERRKK